MNEKIRLKTKSLRLRPMTDAEMEALIERTQDAHDRAAYGQMLAASHAHPDAHAWYACWQMTQKDGTFVGDACFKGAPENAETEIGYGVLADYRGKGYATEAVGALTEWAFSASEALYYVTAETDPDNAASQRVLEKNGFVPTGEQGEEGPRYEKERPETSWLAIYLSIGLCLGVAIGTSLGNLALGIPIGMGLGLAVGTSLDKKAKDALTKVREERARRKTPEA